MAAGAVRTAARIAQRPSFEGPISSPATERDPALNANSAINGIRSARGNRAGMVPAELRQPPAANDKTGQTLDPVLAHAVVQDLLSDILEELKAQRSTTDLIANSPALSKLADGSAMGTQELRDAAAQLKAANTGTTGPEPVQSPKRETEERKTPESGTPSPKESAKDTARIADAVEKMDDRDARVEDDTDAERQSQRQREARLEARESRWRQQDKRGGTRDDDGEEKKGFLTKLATGDFAGMRGELMGAALSVVGLEDFSDQVDGLIQSQAEKGRDRADGAEDAEGEKKPGLFKKLMSGSVADRLAKVAGTGASETPRLPAPDDVAPRRTPADAGFGATAPSFDTDVQKGSDVVAKALPSPGNLSSAMSIPALAGGLVDPTTPDSLFDRSDRRAPAPAAVPSPVPAAAGASEPNFGNLSSITLSADRVILNGGAQPAPMAGGRPAFGRAAMLPAPTGRRGLASNGAPLRPTRGGPARRVGKFGAMMRKPSPTGDKARDRINKIEFFVIKQEQKALRRLMKTLERVEKALPKGGMMGRLMGRSKLGRLLGFGDALGGMDGWGSDRGRGRNNRRPGTRGGRMRQFMGNAMKGMRGVIGGTVAAVGGAASRVGGMLGMGGGRGGRDRARRPRRGIGGRVAGMFGRGARAATAVGGSLLGMSALGGMFGGGGAPDVPQPVTKPTMAGRAKDVTGRVAASVKGAAPGIAGKVGAATTAGAGLMSRAANAAPGTTKVAKTAGKAAGSAAGALGRGALKAARFIPGVGQALTAGMAVYDGFQGWGRAGENFGVGEGEKATTGQKISSSVGGILSGLSFGLLDEGSVARGVHGIGSGIGSAASKIAEYSPVGLAAKGFKSLFGGGDEDKKGKDGGSTASKIASYTPVGLAATGVKSLFGSEDGDGKKGGIAGAASKIASYTPIGLAAKGFKSVFGGDDEASKGSDAVKGASVRSTGHIGEGVGLLPEGSGKDSGDAGSSRKGTLAKSTMTSVVEKAKTLASYTPVGLAAKGFKSVFGGTDDAKKDKDTAGGGLGGAASKIASFTPIGLIAKSVAGLVKGSDDAKGAGTPEDPVSGATMRSTGAIAGALKLSGDQPSSTGNPVMDRRVEKARQRAEEMKARDKQPRTDKSGQEGRITLKDGTSFASTGNPVMDRRVAKARQRMADMQARNKQLNPDSGEPGTTTTRVVKGSDGSTSTRVMTSTSGSASGYIKGSMIRTTGSIGPALDLSDGTSPGASGGGLGAKALLAGAGAATRVGTPRSESGVGAAVGTDRLLARMTSVTAGKVGADGAPGNPSALSSASPLAGLSNFGETALKSTPVGMIASQVTKALGLEAGPKSVMERAKAAASGAMGNARGAFGAVTGQAGALMSKVGSFSPLSLAPEALSKLFGGDTAPTGKGRAVSGSVRSTGAFFGDMVPGVDGKAKVQPGRTLEGRVTSLGMAKGLSSSAVASKGTRSGGNPFQELLSDVGRMMGISGVVGASIPSLSSIFSPDKGTLPAGGSEVARGSAVTASHMLDTSVKLPPAIQDQVLQNDTILSKVANSMTGRGSSTGGNPLTARPGETTTAKRAFKARPSASGQNRSRGGGASGFHVDDYGIAVMNSILFD